jgi:ATP-dependent exoDNAse (exonuclease V) beta subunit
MINSIIASAGTGKTTRLVHLIASETKADTPAEKILGTTFTVKAAEELVARARGKLVKDGDVDRSTKLLAARLGTVNSVCGRLIAEFALDLGRSPAIEVLAEEALESTFNIATDSVIGRSASTIAPLAEAFGFDQLRGDASDWRNAVKTIVDRARENGINAEGLLNSCQRSLQSLDAILPPANSTADELDRALEQAIDAALSAVDNGGLAKRGTRATDEALKFVRSCKAVLMQGEHLPWHAWAKLAKLKPGKQDEALFDPIKLTAAGHAAHPRLRENVNSFVKAMFHYAAEALSAYADYKSARGLVDFVDQEALALDLLRRPELQGRLAERIEAVFVDEFQDSSPIQVAIFAALSRIAARNTWVGDPKQAIYGFRGSAPDLTIAAAKQAPSRTGGKTEMLGASLRSRPSLVSFFNVAFTPAFLAMGLDAEESAFASASREEPTGAGPSLHVWWLMAKNKSVRLQSIAQAVKSTLVRATPIIVQDGDCPRQLKPGDIAVFARSGDDVAGIAAALREVGLKTAVEQGELLAAPEVELTLAALRWLADRSDRLAAAQIARLLGGDKQPSDWLSAVEADDPDNALAALVPFADVIERLRERQLGMTPSELLDALLIEANLVEIARRWGDAGDRTEALDALRRLSRVYEAECANLRKAATLSGLTLYLEHADAKLPESKDRDAISVLTYHKAKGLEWPFVVLTSLENVRPPNPFGIAVESNCVIDWRQPLQGRWIRLWPWPYGAQEKDVVLDAAAANSACGQAVGKREREEAIRLLYVGMSRARDHLALAMPRGKGSAWLDLLAADDTAPHVSLPSEGSAITVADQTFPAEIMAFEPAVSPIEAVSLPPFEIGAVETRPFEPLVITPSAEVSGSDHAVLATRDYNWRMPIKGDPDMHRLGEAVHSSFACDSLIRIKERSIRLGKIRATLTRWSIVEVSAEDVLTAADRLWAFIDTTFPCASWRSEVPLVSRLGDQLVRGRIDILVEGRDWFSIIDHKSFPGSRATWQDKAVRYAPQLALYAKGAEAATSKLCRSTWIHMPVIGAFIQVGRLKTLAG